MEDLKEYVKQFNPTYSAMFDFFSEKYGLTLLISESDEILYKLENTSELDVLSLFFYEEYSLILDYAKVQEIIDFVKNLKD